MRAPRLTRRSMFALFAAPVVAPVVATTAIDAPQFGGFTTVEEQRALMGYRHGALAVEESDRKGAAA